jgi:hypothetical protein
LKSICSTAEVALPSGSLPKKGLSEPGREIDGFGLDDDEDWHTAVGMASNTGKVDNSNVWRILSERRILGF